MDIGLIALDMEDKTIKKLREDIIKLKEYLISEDYYFKDYKDLKNLVAALDETCLDDKYISKSEMARRTQEAMDKLKNTGKIFTGGMFGWDNVEDGTVYPNWDEQDLIDYMRYLYYKDQRSGSFIANKLNDAGYTGKRGGKWQGQSVLRTITNAYHIKRNSYKKPDWWGDSHYHSDILILG